MSLEAYCMMQASVPSPDIVSTIAMMHVIDVPNM